MPSSMYWAALGAWSIRTGDLSPEGYFRRQYDYRQLSARTARADDPEARELLPGHDLDPHLPQPPDEWLKAAGFALTPEEEQYLSDLIAASTRGSMLSWLIRNQPGNSPDYVWQIDNLGDAPEQLRDLVDHARRFHTAIHGAAWSTTCSWRARATETIWSPSTKTASTSGATSSIDCRARRLEPHRVVGNHPPPEPAPAPGHHEVREQLARPHRSDLDLPPNRAASELISTRERQIKGGRARLVNQAALDRWSGGSGLGRHDFRWLIARGHLADLYDARAAS